MPVVGGQYLCENIAKREYQANEQPFTLFLINLWRVIFSNLSFNPPRRDSGSNVVMLRQTVQHILGTKGRQPFAHTTTGRRTAAAHSHRSRMHTANSEPNQQ